MRGTRSHAARSSNERHPVTPTHVREVVRFLARWAPYDGGDDEIFVEFGMPPASFYPHALELLCEHPTAAGDLDIDRLIGYCRRKAAIASPRVRG